MSNENTPDGLDLVFNAGTALSVPRMIGNRPFVVVPEGYDVRDLSHMLPSPPEANGTARLGDPESFIAYVTMHKGEATDLYYETEPASFTAVFNASRIGAPGWGNHRAVYKCPLSPEWMTWTKNDGLRMNQEEFALFVERNLPDIVDPDAADLLEIVTTLQAKKKVNFVSGLRLSNGSNEFTYEEQVEGSAAKGKLQIPEEITLGIPVFRNDSPYAVKAKFRYRITEGRLAIWYELVRPHIILDDAMKELRTRIENETGLSALFGQPA